RARRELRGGMHTRRSLQHRSALLTCLEQVSDIAFGSVQLGDMPVCVLSIEVMGDFLSREYLPVKKNLNPEWFKVGQAELPGALEWRRDLAVEAAAHLLRYGRHFDEAGMPAIFGAAAEDVADLAIEARVRDPQVSFRLAQLLVRNLLDLIPNARPIGLNGLFK